MKGQNPASQQEVVSLFSVFLPSSLPLMFLGDRTEEHRSGVFPRELAQHLRAGKGGGVELRDKS